VITTDCGADMDDQWAIAHAALSPRVRTLAVIGNFAPEPHHLDSGATTRCTRQALEAVGRLTDVPVHASADHALPDRGTPVRSPGVEHLIQLSKAFSPERRLVVLAFGPATDIASALLIDPSLAARVEVVALAFDRYPEGGDGWNVRNDVAAWQVLLDAEVPVTTASGYVALAHLNLTRGESAAMVRGLGAAGAYLACLHATWLDAFGEEFKDETGGSNRWPVWDEAVVAVVLGLSGQRARPRPALAEDGSFSFPNARSRAPYRWVETIDRERLFEALVARLGDLEREGDGRSLAEPSRSRGAASAVSPALCWLDVPKAMPGGGQPGWIRICRERRRMPLVRVRHVLPNGRVRWLESVLPADDADIMVWSTDPADAAVFDLPGPLRDDLLARLGERVLRDKVELLEEKTV
jgi:inosine-uridine nucleoside N-ribohydrolase